MSGISELFDLAFDIQELFLGLRWKYCFIGGLTVQHWGEPRVTMDVDLTLITGFGNEEIYIDECLRHFEPRVPEAREFALLKRVLLLKDKRGFGIDIALGALPFEESAVARAKDIEVGDGIKLRFCTAEDLIVMKAFANRDRDWQDVKMAIVRQGEALDWKYIREQLGPLLIYKEEPEIMDRLERLREKHNRRTL